MTFTDARHIARMTRDQVANYLQLSKRSISRYEQTGKTPKAVIECLLMIGGQCPEFNLRNDFTGWSFGNGCIYSPAGDRFTSGDVLAIIYDKQLIRSQRVELEAHKKKAFNTMPDNVLHFPIKRIKHDLIA